VNFSNLPNLQVFSLYTIANCETLPIEGRNVPLNPPSFAALHNINIILGTIPEFNKMTNLRFDFFIMGLPECLNQNWVGMFNEIIRIGGGKPLELELMLTVSFSSTPTGAEEFYMRIMEKAALVSDCSNICTHWWNPTLTSPPPSRQVRTRCVR
jgi:hypothetical protein